MGIAPFAPGRFPAQPGPEGAERAVEKGLPFDRRLYAARRAFEQSHCDAYAASLSSRTIVCKGMFLVDQLRRFYPDLQDPNYQSAIACTLGAEAFGFATAPLVAMGCVMMRRAARIPARWASPPRTPSCAPGSRASRNTWSASWPWWPNSCGRSWPSWASPGWISWWAGAICWKSGRISPAPGRPGENHFLPQRAYDFHLENTRDEKVLLKELDKALSTGQRACLSLKVSSTNRALGAILGSEITRRFGQSFGAFLPQGARPGAGRGRQRLFRQGLVQGRAGGVPAQGQPFRPRRKRDRRQRGPVRGYLGQRLHLRPGGRRFCVRNSGAVAVVEAWGTTAAST